MLFLRLIIQNTKSRNGTLPIDARISGDAGPDHHRGHVDITDDGDNVRQLDGSYISTAGRQVRARARHENETGFARLEILMLPEHTIFLS